MDHEQVERNVARRSAQIYLPLAASVSSLFLLGANWLGGYPAVALIGGAVWVGLLSLIVSMPIVTDRVKRQAKRRD